MELRFGVWLVIWLSIARTVTSQVTGTELFIAFALSILCAAWLTPRAIREWRAEASERRFNRAYKRGQKRRENGDI